MDDGIRSAIENPNIMGLLTNVVMSNRALIVVEGKDDIQVYDDILEYIDRNHVVRAIENIDGYTEGSECVIKLTSDIQDVLSENKNNIQNHFLAIIDKDVRDFRPAGVNDYGTISSFLNLFILQHYSFESYFVNKEVISSLLKDFTHVNRGLISEQLITHIYNDIENEILDRLYYPSLESLKNAITSGYVSIVQYGMNYGQIKNDSSIRQNLVSKQNVLSQFANSLGLNIDFNCLKRFCKGKWLLECFCDILKEKISNLVNDCSSSNIVKCQYCASGDLDKCLYKVKISLNNVEVSLIRKINGNTELNYIADKLRTLST